MTEPFDDYATAYDETLNRGLEVTGENKRFFAEGRIRWTAQRATELRPAINAVLDYGCGTGESASILAGRLACARVVGVDSSEASLAIARRTHATDRVRFEHVAELESLGPFELVYVNGVFHHVPKDARATVVAAIARTMAPGGLLALWENNPFNPGTRWVMKRLPFDRDAVLLAPSETSRLLRSSGFDVIEIRHHFFFPRALATLRPVERVLRRVPLGGQYVVLAQRM